MENKIYKDEIDFKENLKDPSKWIGLIYVALLIFIIVLGSIYIRNLEYFEKNKILPDVKDSLFKFVDLPVSPASRKAAVKAEDYKLPTQAILAKGKEIYNANCASCHGEEGKGDGKAGSGLIKKPRNFADNKNWVNGREFSEIFRTIYNGFPASGMASYSNLDYENLLSLTHYVRSFASDFPEIQQTDFDILEAEFQLSKGKIIPATIPIGKSKFLFVKEEEAHIKNAEEIILKLNSKLSEDDKILLNKYANDLQKLIVILSKNSNIIKDFETFKNFIKINPIIKGLSQDIIFANKEELEKMRKILLSI